MGKYENENVYYDKSISLLFALALLQVTFNIWGFGFYV